MARSRIATGLEKLMSDLPNLLVQKSLARDAQMKQLSIAASQEHLKAAANFQSEAEFDNAANMIMDELEQYDGDPVVAMSGSNALKTLKRLKGNFIAKNESLANLNSGFAKAKELSPLDSTSALEEVYQSISTTLDKGKRFLDSGEYKTQKKALDNLAESIKVRGMINVLDDHMTGVKQPGVQSTTDAGIILQTANNLVKAGYNSQALNLYAEASKKINIQTNGMIAKSSAPYVRQTIRTIQDFDMSRVDENLTNLLSYEYKNIPANSDFTPETLKTMRAGFKTDLINILSSDQFYQPGASIFDNLPGKYDKTLDGVIKFMMDENVKPEDMGAKIEETLDVPGIFSKNKEGSILLGHLLNGYMYIDSTLNQMNINTALGGSPDPAIASYISTYGQTQGGTVDPNAPVPQSTSPKGAPQKVQNTIPPQMGGNYRTAGSIGDDEVKVTTTNKGTPIITTSSGKKPTKQQVNQALNKIQSRAVKKGDPRLNTGNWVKSGNQPAPTVTPQPTPMVKPTSNKVEETIWDPATQKNIPFSEYKKKNPGYGGLVDKAINKVAAPAKQEKSPKYRVLVKEQNIDEPDETYIGRLEDSQIKKINIHSDFNIKTKLFREAIKDLESFTQQVAIDAMNAKQQGASKKAIKKAEDEHKYYKDLLQSFKKDRKLTREKIEYLYALFSHEYDGVDDFLASLSNGRIGIE
jgi:hypothetical protein